MEQKVPDGVGAEILKQQQEQRSQEIREIVAFMERDKRYGLLVTGVVWAWLAVTMNRLP